MQGRTPEYDKTVVNSHIAVQAVRIIQDGKVVLTPTVHSGSVTADRLADQMRTMEVELADPGKTLTPVDMNSILAPYGTRIQLFKGVRKSSVDTRSAGYGTSMSWVPVDGSTGAMAGVKVDNNGALTLGP